MSVSGDTDPNDKRWRLWGGVAVAALLVIGVVLGILVIPIVQGQAGGIDPWTAICRAIGIAPGSPARPTPTSESPPYPVTRVSWTDATLNELYRAQRKDGEALAQERCIACHTVEGNTPDPTIPRNAGQSRFAIYKQLHDYKSGARVSDVMSPLVADLSDKQIADLAAFYGALVRGAIDPQRDFPALCRHRHRKSCHEGRYRPRRAALHLVSWRRGRRPDRDADDHRPIRAVSRSSASRLREEPASQRHLSSHAQHCLAPEPDRDEDAGDLLFRSVIKQRRGPLNLVGAAPCVLRDAAFVGSSG